MRSLCRPTRGGPTQLRGRRVKPTPCGYWIVNERIRPFHTQYTYHYTNQRNTKHVK